MRRHLTPSLVVNQDKLSAELAKRNDNIPQITEQPKKKSRMKVYVVAIDFGTTYSGYAFAFMEDFKRDPLKSYTEIWQGSGHLSSKAPTTILLTNEEQFDSFGYKAEEKYTELLENDEAEGWRFFKQFKMKLFENKVSSFELQPEIKEYLK